MKMIQYTRRKDDRKTCLTSGYLQAKHFVFVFVCFELGQFKLFGLTKMFYRLYPSDLCKILWACGLFNNLIILGLCTGLCLWVKLSLNVVLFFTKNALMNGYTISMNLESTDCQK